MANTVQSSVAKRFVARAIATGCGSGYLRPAPGTWGSAAALGALIVWQPAGPWLAAILLASLPLAYWAIATVQQDLSGGSDGDPGWIVVDEWQGLALAWLLAGATTYGAYGLLFVAFRFFDARKLGPIRMADEKLSGPWGVMVDD